MPQPETTPPRADPPRAEDKSHAAKVASIGHTLAGLDPGPLAELRRMSFDGHEAAPPYFYRLAAKHDLPQREERTWARIVKLMANLTEKGRDERKASPHTPSTKENGWHGLGTALCDGGDSSWPGGDAAARPMLSEDRLARLLAAKGATRAALLERAIRMLAARKQAHAGVNCVDLARLLLDDDPEPVRKIARDYYRRLDAGARRGGADETDDTSGAHR